MADTKDNPEKKVIKTSASPPAEFVYELKIPKDRVPVLIGTKGETKKQLEAMTRTKIQVDSKEGDVTISGKDPLTLYTTREINAAIGRGFSPDRAQTLLRQENGFELINLRDYAKSDNDLIRLRGRVIGEDGKSRRVIEELTGVYMSVYGKTIAMIGDLEGLPIARRAIEAILAGSRHASVYRWLENQRKKLRQQQLSQGGF
ncbi:MAG: KH domain-containing protein [Nanoarchaeota archaeon]